MSKTGIQPANGEVIGFLPRQTEQAQGIVAACAILWQQLQDTKEEIQQRLREIKHNQEYIAQRQILLLKEELKELRAMAESLHSNHRLQQKIIDHICINETLIEQISKVPNGALPDVKKAEKVMFEREEILHGLQQKKVTLQQKLEVKKIELQLLNLNGASVHIPWSFFQDTSSASGDEEDEPIPTTFRTLNRSRNDQY